MDSYLSHTHIQGSNIDNWSWSRWGQILETKQVIEIELIFEAVR